MLKSILASVALTAAALVSAQSAVLYPHAQALADETVRRNAALLDVILHVSPEVDAKNVVVVAHLRGANGEASGDDDLGVAKTGAPLVELQKDGVRLGILLQLRDAGRHPIGAVGLMFPYKPGDDVEAAVKRAFAIRDAMAARIPSRAALVG